VSAEFHERIDGAAVSTVIGQGAFGAQLFPDFIRNVESPMAKPKS